VFVNNVRARRVEEAIVLAGGRETLPKIDHDGVSVGVCVSYHGKGACFEGCIRTGSHSPLTAAEKVPFHAWYDLASARERGRRYDNRPLVAEFVAPVGPRIGIVKSRVKFKLQF
jgi:hypothetical protein